MNKYKSNEDLAEYRSGKGTIQFSYDKTIPWKLIERVVKFRVKENYLPKS